MEQVTVARVTLLRAIERNRVKHKAAYDKAIPAYRRKLIEAHERALVKAKRGDAPGPILLRKPEQHLDEYDRVIGMLKMHTEDTITLTAGEYDSYIRDKWDWSAAFFANTTSYASMKAPRMPRKGRR